MRYYDVEIIDKNRKRQLSINTKNNVGLQIELNAVVNGFSQTGTATLKIFNLPVKYFMRQMDFVGMTIRIKGGMSKGLPLSKPEQQGVLIFGTIQFCIGEREKGVNYLMFSIVPGPALQTPFKGVVLKWDKGTRLNDALRNAMVNAGFNSNQYQINISDDWVATGDSHASYKTMNQLGQALNNYSRNVTLPKDAIFINLYFDAGSERYIITDGTTAPRSKIITLYDFIGQPYWINGSSYNINTTVGFIALPVTLRGDLKPFDQIEVVDPQVTKVSDGSSAILLASGARVGFKGKMTISQLTHVANYSTAGGENWVTIIEAYL